MTFNFQIPLPPSLNTCFPTSFKTGKRFPSDDYKAWKKVAGFTLLETLRAHQVKINHKDNPTWEFVAGFYFPKKSYAKSDLDNRIKPTLDLICSVTNLKDNQVKRIEVAKFPSDLLAEGSTEGYVNGSVIIKQID